jgi:hypothetical protein
MNQFNVHKWKNNQLLKEAGLLNENQVSQVVKAIDSAISSVDDSLSYKVLASAVAQILKNEYGSHNFDPFMEVLHAELGIDKSLNESEADFANEFKEKFDVRTSLTSDKIEVLEREDIDEDTFEEMIKFIEDKGYTVDRKQSDRYHEVEPGERDFFPRIKFSK